MTLEFDGGQKIEKPSADQIKEAVGDLRNRKDSFLILSSNSMDYIQVAVARSARFSLEYQDGDTTRHFRAKEQLPLSRVIGVLIQYSRGDAKWQAALSWKHDARLAGRTGLMTASLVLCGLGFIMMLPALFTRGGWPNSLFSFGSAVVSLGLVANLVSAVLHQRMWGRFSIATPDGFGGVIMFRMFVFLYALLAVVFALLGARIGWQVT